jgi:hypothetical protein
MDYWYKVTTPRKEVREGRSFNPDEFAIHLEQVIGKTAPEDYRNPEQFFSRTCFTRALRDHIAEVMRRLSGETANTAPVMTLITQFGGGKTHTLTALYHLATSGEKAINYSGVSELLKTANLARVPEAKVAAFVGNAWDPKEGRENPWLDIAWQLAGENGIKELGTSAKTVPPGTEALTRLFTSVGKPVLLLFDEVLNFINRHRSMSDHFYAFIQNLTVAVTGMTHGAVVISLPRSQVEMTDLDMQWQEKITKVVRRVAKDLIANDEAEIGEVIRRRLFENIGSEATRKTVAKAYADWCFERRAQLPPEWTYVDTASSDASAKKNLQNLFETCYPFHPATISVFRRKWQALPQYQQTRGTLAMFAQWISHVFSNEHIKSLQNPLITLGSAPLEVPEFRSVILGQLGEQKLQAAIDADISGAQSHAKALDADTKGSLKDIHRRVGTAILFESSGGQIDKVAHLPELRFAICEPDVDTASVDNAAYNLESKSYFIRKVSSDGYILGYQPTLKKVVNDRRASLDEESEIKPAMRDIIEEQFNKNKNIPIVFYPPDAASIPDTPRLTMVVTDPSLEWTDDNSVMQKISEWTCNRGTSPRLYPGAIIWCVKKQGRNIQEKVKDWLAWERVSNEVNSGTLGKDFNKDDFTDIKAKVSYARDVVKDEVWGSYRYTIIYDTKEHYFLRTIDLGAGHSSSNETLCGRIINALKSNGILNETVTAGYIERNWPPALKESWPLSSLRQSFLNGSLTRIIDPDNVLRSCITDFIQRGEFGLASGRNSDGTYTRIWFEEKINSMEVSFEPDVYLIIKTKAKSQKRAEQQPEQEMPLQGLLIPDMPVSPKPPVMNTPSLETSATPSEKNINITGKIPPDSWNRIGTKIIPKIRSGNNLQINVAISFSVDNSFAQSIESELDQIIDDIGLSGDLKVVK